MEFAKLIRICGAFWQELTQRVASRQKPQKTPAVGFEPTTNRLTADRSTTELRWIDLVLRKSAEYILPIHCYRASANRLIPTVSGLYH